MPSSIIFALDYATKQISIYFGIPLLLIGILGALLNILVFLSLKTFRQNVCTFYLTIMSFTNIGLLLTGLVSRITISGFAIDWTQDSTFYCKFRFYTSQFSILLSLTCICLATIDQYMTTNISLENYRHNSHKFARILILVFVFIWLLHGIPYLFFYNVIKSSSTGESTCSITSFIFQKYTIYGFLLILSGILPLLITSIFGLLSYRNIRQIVHRNLPLVRRELDKQMTAMVLVHVVFDLFTLVPFIVVNILALTNMSLNNSTIQAYIQFAKIVTTYFYYLYFVCPFYIYICVSKRFRHQLIYVLFHNHFNRNVPEQAIIRNQVPPQMK